METYQSLLPMSPRNSCFLRCVFLSSPSLSLGELHGMPSYHWIESVCNHVPNKSLRFELCKRFHVIWDLPFSFSRFHSTSNWRLREGFRIVMSIFKSSSWFHQQIWVSHSARLNRLSFQSGFRSESFYSFSSSDISSKSVLPPDVFAPDLLLNRIVSQFIFWVFKVSVDCNVLHFVFAAGSQTCNFNEIGQF